MPDANALQTSKFGQVGSVGAGETTLLNFLLKPGLFRTPGDMLHTVATLITAANGNNKTSKLYFGGQGIGGRGPAADNNSVQIIEHWITYKGGNVFQGTGVCFNLTSASCVVINNDAIIADPGSAIEIKLTGQGTADNDLVSRVLKYSYLPAFNTFGF